MRVGMIGLDTSHVVAFTDIFRDPGGNADLADVQIVAGFPAGTDLPQSRDRVNEFSAQLADKGVEIVDSIPSLLERVDAVMLESVDGAVHLEQAIPVLEARIPVFIDKPIAGSLRDTIEIRRLAQQHGVPCFSSSCIRYSPNLCGLKNNKEVGDIVGAATWGLCQTQDNIPDLFFYGLHGIEGLFALMGRGCVTVQRTHLADVEIVVGTWNDGRVGTYRGIRSGKAAFGATVFGTEQISTIEIGIPYRELCIEIARFFKSGVAPVDLDETIEIFAFMEAAEESKRQGGRAVSMVQHSVV
jgi:hypothetical protein